MAVETAQGSDVVSVITKDRAARRHASREEVAGWILSPPDSRSPEQVSAIVSLLSLFPKLRTAGEACLSSLARQVPAIQPGRWEVLSRPGDPSDVVYLIVEGTVALADQQQNTHQHNHQQHSNHHSHNHQQHHSHLQQDVSYNRQTSRRDGAQGRAAAVGGGGGGGGGAGSHRRRSSGGGEREDDVLQRYSAWELVGDELVLTGMRWACRAQVTSQRCTLLSVSRQMFNETIAQCVRASFNRKIDFISRLPVFGNMPRRVVERLVPFFYELELGPKDLLCRQGDPADCLWAVVNGRCYVLIDPGWSPAANRPPEMDPKRTTQIASIQSGQLVGEMCVFGNVRHRPATVRCATEVLLYRLQRLHFLRVCPPTQLEELRAIAEAKMMLLVQAQREEQGTAAKINQVLRGHCLRELHQTSRKQELRGAVDSSASASGSASPARQQRPSTPSKPLRRPSSPTYASSRPSLERSLLHAAGTTPGDGADVDSPRPPQRRMSVLDLDADATRTPWATISTAAAEFVRPPPPRMAAGSSVGLRLESLLAQFSTPDWLDGLSTSGCSDEEEQRSTGGGNGGALASAAQLLRPSARTASSAAVLAPAPISVAALPFGWGYSFLRAPLEAGAVSGATVLGGNGAGAGTEVPGGSGGGGGGGEAGEGSGLAVAGEVEPAAEAAEAAEAEGSAVLAESQSSGERGSGGGDGDGDGGAALPAVASTLSGGGLRSTGGGAVASERASAHGSDSGSGDSDSGSDSGGSGSGSDGGGDHQASLESARREAAASDAAAAAASPEAAADADAATQRLLKQLPLQLLPLVDCSWNFGPCSLLNLLYGHSNAAGADASGGCAASWEAADGGSGAEGAYGNQLGGPEAVRVPPLPLRRCKTPDMPGPWSERDRPTDLTLTAVGVAVADGLGGAAGRNSPPPLEHPMKTRSAYAFGGGFGNVAAAVATAAVTGVTRGGGGGGGPPASLAPLPSAISTAGVRARAALTDPPPQQLRLPYKPYGGVRPRPAAVTGPNMGGPHSSMFRIARAPSEVRSGGLATAATSTAMAPEAVETHRSGTAPSTTAALLRRPHFGIGPEQASQSSLTISPRRHTREGGATADGPTGHMKPGAAAEASPPPLPPPLHPVPSAPTPEHSQLGGSSSSNGGRSSKSLSSIKRIQPPPQPPPVQVPSYGSDSGEGKRDTDAAADAAAAAVISPTGSVEATNMESGGHVPSSSRSSSSHSAVAGPDGPQPAPAAVSASASASRLYDTYDTTLERKAGSLGGDSAGRTHERPVTPEPEDSIPSFMSYPESTVDGTGAGGGGVGSRGGDETGVIEPCGDDGAEVTTSTFMTSDGAVAAAAAIAAAAAAAPALDADGGAYMTVSAAEAVKQNDGNSPRTFASRKPLRSQRTRTVYGTYGDEWNRPPSPNTWAVVPLSAAASADAAAPIPGVVSGPLSTPFLQYIKAAAAAAGATSPSGPGSPLPLGSGAGAGSGNASVGGGGGTHLPQLRTSGANSGGGAGAGSPVVRRSTHSNHGSDTSLAQSLATHRNVMAAAAASLSSASAAGSGFAGSGGGPSPTANALASLLTKGGCRSTLPPTVRQPNVILKGGFVYRAATGKTLLSEMVNGAASGSSSGGGGGGSGSHHHGLGGSFGGLGAAAVAAAAAAAGSGGGSRSDSGH